MKRTIRFDIHPGCFLICCRIGKKPKLNRFPDIYKIKCVAIVNGKKYRSKTQFGPNCLPDEVFDYILEEVLYT